VTVHERREVPHSCEHPVDTLEREHRVIQSVLGAMEREAGSVQAGQPLRTEFWLGVSEFLENFADGCHHVKEEDLLFPVLAERGIAEDGGPIGVMRQEHVQGRALCQRIHDAATGGDASSLVEASREFVLLLREHIDKEETVLFQLARRILSAEKTTALQAGLAEVHQQQMSEGAYSKYVALAKKLCEDAGVPACR